MKSVKRKREREIRLVSEMIGLYCRKNHLAQNGLCLECKKLDNYAKSRSERCPFMKTKTFCSNCKSSCYEEGMKEKIRLVMRFSGPRMFLYHPIIAVRYVYESKKEKRQLG